MFFIFFFKSKFMYIYILCVGAWKILSFLELVLFYRTPRYHQNMLVSVTKMVLSLLRIYAAKMAHGFQSKHTIKFFHFPHLLITSLKELQTNVIQYVMYLLSFEGKRYRLPQNFPCRIRPSDSVEFGTGKKVLCFQMNQSHSI